MSERMIDEVFAFVRQVANCETSDQGNIRTARELVKRLESSATDPTSPQDASMSEAEHDAIYLRGWNEGIERAAELLDDEGSGTPAEKIRALLDVSPQRCSDGPQTPPDPLKDLVERFSKALLAKLKLAQANGRSGWERDDWEEHCQQGLLRHVDKGDPRDVAAYCAFMWHHGWITAAPQRCSDGSVSEALALRLRDAAQTAQNDDLSDPMSEKRDRHVIRVEAMLDAAEYLEEISAAASPHSRPHRGSAE